MILIHLKKISCTLLKNLTKSFIFWVLLIFIITIPLSSYGDTNHDNEKIIHLFTPEFKEKADQFKISPLQAYVILFSELNRNTTKVENIVDIDTIGGLRCIKGNDYVFSSAPHIPQKGVLMDGYYLDGFTGDFRVIAYSSNHPDKYIKDFPNLYCLYYSTPFLGITSKELWYRIVDSACPRIPEKQRREWAKQKYEWYKSQREMLKELNPPNFDEMLEIFQHKKGIKK